jgi:LuxR family maltose regulon positive regulatory protein
MLASRRGVRVPDRTAYDSSQRALASESMPALPRKLVVPRLRGTIERSRLLQALKASSAEAAVTWLHAPAGYGKTVLLADCAATWPQALWYSVDAGDGDPSALFHYAALAARAVVGRALDLPNLQASSPPRLCLFARRYFQELFAQLPDNTCCIFDDFHEAQLEQPWRLVFSELVSAIPPHIRVCVGSREPPPRELARQHAEGRLSILDRSEIAFTRGELAEFAQRLAPGRDHAMVEEQASALFERSQGWIIAAAIITRANGAALPTETRKNAPHLSARRIDRQLFDYLISEVVERLGPREAELLTRMAFFPSFSIDEAAKATGWTDVTEVIERLCDDLRLLECDASGRYRFHDVLRTVATERARRILGADVLRQMLVETALAIGDPDTFGTAAELLASAQDWQSLAVLVERDAPELARRHQWRTIQSALDIIPEEERNRLPWITYWLAASCLTQNPQRAMALAEHAYVAFQRTHNAQGIVRSWVLIIHSIIYAGSNFRPLVVWLEALDVVRKCAVADQDLSADVACAEYVARSFWEPGSDATKLAAEGAFGAEWTLDQNRLLVCAAMNNVYIMEPTPAIRHLHRAAHDYVASNLRDPALRLLHMHSKAVVDAWIQGNTRDALLAVQDALALGDESGADFLSEMLCLMGMGCALNRGDMGAVQQMLKHMSGWDHGPPMLRGPYGYALGLHAFEVRDLDGCMRGMRASLEGADALGFVPGAVHSWISLALCAAERQCFEEADKHISTAELLMNAQCRARGFAVCLDFARAYVAIAAGLNPDLPLRRALRNMGTSGVIPLMFGRRVMGRLIALAFKANIEPDAAARFVSAFALKPDQDTALLENWPWRIRLRTFGRLHVCVDGKELKFGRKLPTVPLALLKLLACQSHPLTSDEVKRALWPGHGASGPRNVLDTAVYRLRQILGVDEVLLHSGGTVTLNSDLCWTDARVLLAIHERGIGGKWRSWTETELETFESLLGSFGAENFAADETSPAFERERGRLSRTWSTVARNIADRWLAMGHAERSQSVLERLTTTIETSGAWGRGSVRTP